MVASFAGIFTRAYVNVTVTIDNQRKISVHSRAGDVSGPEAFIYCVLCDGFKTFLFL